ncbi:hypothetical protein [Sphingomonas morindae]|uniref:Uncharacterized protein n=1 Tax=Sphingomonas morindae TaxID=1541170 RepID=A0ABY4X4V5_9SPHN|nr:hypothetical protein [Sphingomonas morindae]USI71933.1 hypothetical protein LHA26_11470 [Sphingomonas morindae]
MIYNLEEQAALYESQDERPGDEAVHLARGTLRELVTLAMGWDSARFAHARIITVTQENYGAEGIRAIAEREGLGARTGEAHPS